MAELTTLQRLWSRLPVLVRAIAGGGFVFLALQTGCMLLLVANLQVATSVPWTAPLSLAYLWVVFQYFNGRWKPDSTSAARREAMRARRLGRREWLPASIAIAAAVVFIIATTVISYRLIDVPAEDTGLPETSKLTLYTLLLMIALVAGVSEEAGFRGYMQGAIEKRYHPAFAVAVSALMFWAAHLNHANGVPRIVALCIMGATLGILTVYARSILPAMIAHASSDAIIFLCGTAGVGPDYLWNPVPLRETGLDGFFWVTVVAVIIAGSVGYVALRRVRGIAGEEAVPCTGVLR
jgi:membrane protease YdiL (CAAX protease family)